MAQLPFPVQGHATVRSGIHHACALVPGSPFVQNPFARDGFQVVLFDEGNHIAYFFFVSSVVFFVGSDFVVVALGVTVCLVDWGVIGLHAGPFALVASRGLFSLTA